MTGLLLGVYQFNELKTLERDKIKEIEEGVLLGETSEETKRIDDGLKTGRIISESVCMARDLVNGPSNRVTPTVLAEKAEKISREHGMELQVLEVSQAEAMGMGAFVAVAKGSQEPAKFIILEYNKGKGFDTIALVGKGITFDSGGISLKPSEGMERMKDDMSGAAAVLGTMQAAARLQLPSPPGGNHSGDGEPSERKGLQARGCLKDPLRTDRGGDQHRCRGKTDPL